MNPKALKAATVGLGCLALCFGLDLPRFFLPGWTVPERMALDAAAQLLAYATMAGLALAAEPLTGGRGGVPPSLP